MLEVVIVDNLQKYFQVDSLLSIKMEVSLALEYFFQKLFNSFEIIPLDLLDRIC